MSPKIAIFILLIAVFVMAGIFAVFYLKQKEISDTFEVQKVDNQTGAGPKELSPEEKREQLLETLSDLNSSAATSSPELSPEEKREQLLANLNDLNTATASTGTPIKKDSAPVEQEKERQKLLDTLKSLNTQ
ncbi:hypothetical protein HY798_02070 [Candidatus Falkowbacteria bacterium]|nr:hypothetical protein [Candidatus Falkowbacteria bacterium]